MKKFQFSLDTVLSFKQQEQDAVRAEHAEILARLHEQEEILESIQEKYRSYNEEFCRRKSEGIQITEARLYQNGLRVLEDNIRKQTEILEDLRRQEEKKRERVVEAKKETATLENLKDKKLRIYNKAVEKSEEQFIEEFVSTARVNSRLHSA